MREPMREVTEGLDVSGVDRVYPGVRKVTVDEANRTAYVFGRGNRATVVRGAEFETLAAALPPAVEAPAVEAVEPDGVVEQGPPAKAARPGRGNKKES